MPEEIKNKKTKEILLTEEDLGKVSGGSMIGPDEEYTWSCSYCGYSITTIGYGYSYKNCPFCGRKVTSVIPKDFPKLAEYAELDEE